jgi:hypothetical protein
VKIDWASSSLCVLGLDLSSIGDDRINPKVALGLDSDACAPPVWTLLRTHAAGHNGRKGRRLGMDSTSPQLRYLVGSSMCLHQTKLVRNKSDLGFLPVICYVLYFVLLPLPNMADQAYIVNVLSYISHLQLLCLLRPSHQSVGLSSSAWLPC